MKSLLLIVVLSLLAVGYARDQEAELAIRGGKKGDHTKRGSEGYSHGEILMFKCSEMRVSMRLTDRRKTAKNLVDSRKN